ncbi:hypothetical protein SteCoe_1480 [Stentor coeruleus]|uniref:Uncharacterized protein n=1 Tax=Stentor coeruleus TaxID=5963 RepID=A0A1R2D1X3_9CILI|nr:hypothetical protein SteCoe_1480 [Stentor coeruleus]
MQKKSYSSRNLARKKLNALKKNPLKLPPIEKQVSTKSLSPNAMPQRSKSPVMVSIKGNTDWYFDEFDKIYQRNNELREQWVASRQGLIRYQFTSKLHCFSPTAGKTENYIN